MLILPWLLAIVLAACDEFVISRLLRREYSNHRTLWDSDGKPRGLFWTPPECKVGWYITYASGRAGRGLALKWLFRTPLWISGDTESHKLIVLHRFLMYGFILSFLAPFVVAALLQ